MLHTLIPSMGNHNSVLQCKLSTETIRRNNKDQGHKEEHTRRIKVGHRVGHRLKDVVLMQAVVHRKVSHRSNAVLLLRNRANNGPTHGLTLGSPATCKEKITMALENVL
mmetsp:Transcript_77473/g.224804  ORF Transcript_77473/g.224804 Transcript_77473/m.224804 type:complete len:109 (-) Transcript_77473:95-421(-)